MAAPILPPGISGLLNVAAKWRRRVVRVPARRDRLWSDQFSKM
jgi:hypothetical protein